MTHSDQTALWEVCESQWKRLRPRWGISLPYADWEDIRSEAFVRVFRQAHRYDPEKGTPETWAGVVMYRSIINSLRPLLPQKDRENHVWLGYLKRPRPILTRVVEVTQWGDEAVTVEPDMVDEANVDPRAATLWTDFMTYLTPYQRVICDKRAGGYSLLAIHRNWFHLHSYQQVWTMARDIQRRWEEFVS